MRRMMMVLLALAIVTPCMAYHVRPYGYQVQRVQDGWSSYVLYSSGNIVKEGSFGRQELIDDGTGTRMIAAGGGNLYCLKNNGNIWMWQGGMRWIMCDNGTGTAEIWVRYGQVHCRKNNGQAWRCTDPYSMQWQPISSPWNAAPVTNFDSLHGR